jgi:hypothetical protein
MLKVHRRFPAIFFSYFFFLELSQVASALFRVASSVLCTLENDLSDLV